MNLRLRSLFRLSYHLLVLAGFLSQALTGALNPLILSLGFGALVFSFFKDRLRPSLVLSRGMGNSAAVVALVFGLVDYFFMSRDLIIASAHLVILVQTIKLFSLNGNRDYYQLYGLSFFGLISAAGLTLGLSFIFSFLFYLLMLTWTLILHHFKEETERAGLNPNTGFYCSGATLLTGRFLMTVSLVAFLSFFITLAFFYTIPRIGFGYLRSRNDARNISGFSKIVDLGVFGPVTLDLQVVMRVEVVPGRDFLWVRPVHWRGMVFDYYNGQSWESRTLFNRLVRSGSNGGFRIRKRTGTGQILEQVFYMEPLDIDVVFSLPGVFSLSGNFLYLKANRMGTIELPRFARRSVRLNYRVRSEIALTRDGREINTIGPPAGDDQDFSLQLPEPFQDVRQLAQQITRDLEDDFEKAEAIEEFLKDRYTYSLDVERNPAYPPIDDFLFHQKKGFCEHFATAMTLMVRSLGIPARLVSGFLGGEWNEFGGYYLLRQKDAHTWVEVYFPERGWVTFDPTPPGVADRPSLPLMTGLFQFVDALRLKWNRYVINYRLGDQIVAVRTAHRKSIHLTQTGQRLLEALKIHYRLWARKAPPWQKTLVFFLTVLGGSGFLCLVLKKWRRLIIPGKKTTQQPIRVAFYREMVKMLEARGFSRTDGATPIEYAWQVIRSKGAAYSGVLDITYLYNCHRFGSGEISPDEMAYIRSTLNRLKNLPRRPNGPRSSGQPAAESRDRPASITRDVSSRVSL